MSKSRSPTPTPRRPTNISPSLEHSTSRLESNEDVPYPTHPRYPGQRFPPHSSIPNTPQPYPAESSRASLRRPAETSPSDERQPKRRKRSATMGARQAEGSSTRSSPSSDSQDGLADTEHDTTGRDRSSQITPAVPPKKKRTRTLTTPHQSAVLHALLAQSRFPTTAMREEVGRAIGLSARKVQIWFQNQRQKARRPRSQSDAPMSQPPQYESYANLPSTGPPHSSEVSTSQGRAPDARVQAGVSLLGPGMPGHEIPPARPIPPESHVHALPEPRLPMTHRSVLDNPYPGMLEGRPGTSSSPSHSFAARTTGRAFSRVLPPLTIVPPPPTMHQPFGTSSNVLPPLTHSAPPTAVSYELRRSPSPDSLFAYRSLEQSARVVQPLPPPFTLQPPPQWDASSMAPRPSTSSWSRPTSRTSGDNPPYILPAHGPRPQSSNDEATTPRLEPHPTPRRPGRYDPVRDNQS